MARSDHSFIFFVAFQCTFLLGSQGCNRQILLDLYRQVTQHNPVDEILSTVKEVLPSDSFEVYAFKVGWYNKLVASKFDLPYSNDTVALSTFTIPGVFNDTFVPFLCKAGLRVANDSWPQFSKYYMRKVQSILLKKLKLSVPDEDILYPDTMLGPGHPQILVQTAAHVAGGAYYYQRQDIIPDAWPKNKTIYGVSIHPLYGGWFLMGPVIIIKGADSSGMKYKPPKDVLRDRAKKIELLNLLNDDWRNQKWRDIISVKKNYTADHLNYSLTYGVGRTTWVTNYYNTHC